MASFSRSVSASLVMVGGMAMASCGQEVQRTSSDNRPMPPTPRQVAAPPADAQADRIVLQVAAKPVDTNANRYPDRIQMLGNLFSEDHALPFYEDGAFVFTLYPGGKADDPDATPIREWRIEGERLERAKIGRTLFGPTYQFDLSLLEEGSDRFPLMTADLVARFEPADGRPPVIRREVHKMQIGADRPGR